MLQGTSLQEGTSLQLRALLNLTLQLDAQVVAVAKDTFLPLCLVEHGHTLQESVEVWKIYETN